jgi:hypothetical protein
MILNGISRKDTGGRMVLITRGGDINHSLRRWLWFVGLYAAGVATLATVAYGLRALLKLFV